MNKIFSKPGPMSVKPNQPPPMTSKPNQPDAMTKKPSFGRRIWNTVKKVGSAIGPSLLKIADNFSGGLAS